MKRIVLAVMLVFLFPKWSAASWTLAPCSGAHSAAWQAFEHTLRSAKRDSLHYLPKPFPKTPEDVVEDYLYQYRRLWPDPARVPPDQRLTYEGVQQNSLRFEVVRVENWTTLRCGEQEEKAFYYLIRIFSAVNYVEFVRAVLSDSGFWTDMSPSTEKERAAPAVEQRNRLLDLNDVLAKIHADFGIEGTTPQYVTVFSVPRMCESWAPCVAFRAGEDTYLRSNRGELFRVPASGRRLSTERELRNPNKAAAIAALGLAANEAIVSLGGTVFAVSQKVERAGNR